MTTELRATGVVISRDPLVTVTADLRSHELVLIMRLPDGLVAEKSAIRVSGDYTVRIGGQKLFDLIRFARLAVDKHNTMTCWRCDMPYMDFANLTAWCPICHMAAHCNACSEYLHASQP